MSFRSLIWIVPVALTVGWIATMTRDYNIELEKQRGFIATACIKAGGSYSIRWSQADSSRPKETP